MNILNIRQNKNNVITIYKAVMTGRTQEGIKTHLKLFQCFLQHFSPRILAFMYDVAPSFNVSLKRQTHSLTFVSTTHKYRS